MSDFCIVFITVNAPWHLLFHDRILFGNDYEPFRRCFYHSDFWPYCSELSKFNNCIRQKKLNRRSYGCKKACNIKKFNTFSIWSIYRSCSREFVMNPASYQTIPLTAHFLLHSHFVLFQNIYRVAQLIKIWRNTNKYNSNFISLNYFEHNSLKSAAMRKQREKRSANWTNLVVFWQLCSPSIETFPRQFVTNSYETQNFKNLFELSVSLASWYVRKSPYFSFLSIFTVQIPVKLGTDNFGKIRWLITAFLKSVAFSLFHIIICRISPINLLHCNETLIHYYWCYHHLFP